MGRLHHVTWTPDGAALLCDEARDDRWEVWFRNIVLNTSRRVFVEQSGNYAIHTALSPDGRQIALLRDSLDEIWAMDALGQDLRRIQGASPGEDLSCAAWSRTAVRVAYLRSYRDAAGSPTLNLETCDLQGGRTIVIRADPRLDSGDDQESLCWLPDGRIIFGCFTDQSATTSEFWAIPV